MAKLILIALAATAAAAPLGAQPGPDYGPPPIGMPPPPPGLQAPEGPPPPGVSWRERAPAGARRYVVQPPATEVAEGVRTRTWVEQGAPPPPPPGMGDGMHHYDGPPLPMDGRHYDGGYDGRHYDGRHYDNRHDERRDGARRHVEIRRYGHGPGFIPPQVGWQGGYGMEGAYGMESPMPPPPCPRACPPRPMPYGYGYGYGAAGATIVTETTVTEAPVVERRVYYTTVRERIRVAPRHHRRACRCKLIKARPTAGERG